MRTEPLLEVVCDSGGCDVSEFIGLTAIARGYDERNVNRELESLGWRAEDGRDICPDCAEKEAEAAK